MSARSPNFSRVSNKIISNWYKLHLNVKRLEEAVANFNVNRNANKNQKMLNNARKKYTNLTTEISGVRRRTGIHLSPNRTRRAVEQALLREVRRRTRDAQRLLRLMSSPRSILLRETGQVRPSARPLYFL
jgi:hypothetical protein